MLGRLAVLSLLVLGSQAYKPDYQNEVLLDKDMLLKQKRVFNILYHLTQPEIKPELYKEGEEWSILANIDSYTNKDVVVEFGQRFEQGMLPHDSIFSVYYSNHQDEARCLFKLLLAAKDFDTFYKTALFLRNHMNHGLFAYSFSLAVIQRPDTKYIRLPPLYELAPSFFYNSELLEKLHHVTEFGKLEPKHSAGYDCYILPYNYSNHYLSDEYDYEQRINYFTEDIGLNNYYFFFRNQLPFFLGSADLGWGGSGHPYRGEEYLYGHKQLLARYYLERLSNQLGSIEDYDYNRPFYAGFWPTLRYPNGMQFPSRPWNSFLPKAKLHQIHEAEEYETRIGQAVDSGIVYTKEQKTAKIFGPEGLNILGNLIEGNGDSLNDMYYGNIDKLQRDILSFNVIPLDGYKVQPSALQQFSTSLRDPAFWRIYKRILHYYYKYKDNLGPYKVADIRYPDFKIESVDVDKLITYFDHFDATVSNGVAVASEQQADAYLVQVRQHRLNHEHFNVRINVNAAKPGKAAIRIFLGPKYNVQNKLIDFNQRHEYFYEMDNFIWELSAGANKIERNCHDFFFVDSDPEPSERLYAKLLKAIEGGEPLKQEKRILAFPQRLLLPRGRPDGIEYQLFVHVAPLSPEPVNYSSRVFGESLVDNRPFGYPLDRPITRPFDFKGPNFFWKDVIIYHKPQHDPTIHF